MSYPEKLGFEPSAMNEERFCYQSVKEYLMLSEPTNGHEKGDLHLFIFPPQTRMKLIVIWVLRYLFVLKKKRPA